MTSLPPIPENGFETLPDWARALIAAMRETIARHEAEIANLKVRQGRNSSNSSRPLSSDPPWKPRARGRKRSGKKPGGQPGHEGHHRGLVPVQECDEVREYLPETCVHCGVSVAGAAKTGEVSRRQRIELPERPAVVREYRAPEVECPCCGKKSRAALPAESEHCLGPGLAATAAILVGEHHVGRRDAKQILSSVLGAEISLGAISQAEEAVAEALAVACEAIREEIVAAPSINMDDTVYMEGVDAKTERLEVRAGARVVRMARKGMVRLWVACSPMAVFFRLVASRGRDVVLELLDGADGIVGSDRLASFLHLGNEQRQICWAHLLRDFEAMAGRAASQELGNLLAMKAHDLFAVWSRYKAGELDLAAVRAEMGPIRASMEMLFEHGPEIFDADITARRTCANLAKLGDALWIFTRFEGVEPTNNAAERALRPAVRWRKRSYGTMSARGSRFVERILTITETLRLRGASPLNYIAAALKALRAGLPPPPIPAGG